MAKESRGMTLEYTSMEGKITVHFPKGEEVCQWCPHCVKDPGNFTRLLCHLSGELLVYPEASRGQKCPFDKTGKEEQG